MNSWIVIQMALNLWPAHGLVVQACALLTRHRHQWYVVGSSVPAAYRTLHAAAADVVFIQAVRTVPSLIGWHTINLLLLPRSNCFCASRL
jgi:hypothetical protein